MRVRGKDSAGASFEALAHTLDLTPTGVRLGAIRRPLKTQETLVVLFRQRRIEFTVMWSRLLGEREYQVGLQMVTKENDPWGVNSKESAPIYAAARQAA